jgi:hypothetical protein
MTSDNANLLNFNQMIDAWVKAATDAERRWNEFFNQQMGTDEFTQMMTRTMETYALMQANFARGMEQYLRSFNIPTHTDIAKLSERLTDLERRIDAMESSDDPVRAEVKPPARKRSGGKRQARSQTKS